MGSEIVAVAGCINQPVAAVVAAAAVVPVAQPRIAAVG